ncbi:MAG TPA: ABC transporter permease [Gemmatimonadaceae bacterium]|jgi:predicted permease
MMKDDGVRRFFRIARADRDVHAEIAFHLESRVRDLVARGMTNDDAWALARKEFGNVDEAQRELVERARHRETRRSTRERVAHIVQDLRYSARSLRGSPAFAAAVILTLTIGIGATTAIFSIVNAVVLQPLPFPQSERIVRLYQVSSKGSRNSVSQPNFFDWEARTHSFSALALFSTWNGTSGVQTPTGPVMAQVTPVTRDFFKVLQARPELGRVFVPEEQQFGGVHAAVISDAFWHEQFGANPDVLGQRLIWNNESYVIIGVLPSRATYPAGTEVWTPLELLTPNHGRTSGGHRVIGRLAPGVSMEQAQRDLSVVSRAMKIEYGNQTSMSDATLVGLRDEMVGAVRPRLLLLLGASAFLLLIGLANALNLLMARLAIRQHELAMRVALGATPWRLVQQVLIESALLVGIAAAAGLWFAALAVRAVVAAPASVLPRADEVGMSWSVLAFTTGISIVLALALGLIATWRSARRDAREALSASSRTMAGAAGSASLRQGMVVGQLALTVVLLIGAALLGRSFLRLLDVKPGFTTEHVAVIDASPTIDDRTQRLEYYNTLIERVKALPGVVAAAAGTGVPIAISPPDGGYLKVDAPVDSITFDAFLNAPASQKGVANYIVTDGNYFSALGIPLLKGRLFDSVDRPAARPAAVVSASFASQAWPNENAIGKDVEFGNMDGDPRSFVVVGVVGDVHDDGLASRPYPALYSYYPQRRRSNWPLSLVVRTRSDPAAMISAVRRVVRELRPDVAVRARLMDRVVSASVADRRFVLFVILAFAGTALVLATLGVYSVISYLVTQRTREIGVRVALGAQRADVLRLVMGEGVRLAVIGLAIGVAGSLLLTRLLRGLMFGVSTTDPVAFGAVVLTLAIVAVLAAYLPGRRAARVDPMEVLRST